MVQIDLPIIAVIISLGSLAVSLASMIISYLAYRRFRPSVSITAQNIPPYIGEETTIFTFENVGSGDLVDPGAYVSVSWAPHSEIFLDWGETIVLSPRAQKVIAYRFSDPPVGQSSIEVEVVASGVKLPKKTFQVVRRQ